MRTITFGNNNSRYALILMKEDRTTHKSYDGIITFIYSNNLKELNELMNVLINLPHNEEFGLNIDIFDYEKCIYVRHY